LAASDIEWTDKVWNAVRGCSLVSQGCKRCYAMRQAHRFSGPGMPYEGLTVLNATGPTWTGKVVCDEKKLDEPLHWKKPCRIFVNSMSDLFHKDVSFEFIDRVFAVMALCPQHTFQILTKRPETMMEWSRPVGQVMRRDFVNVALHRMMDRMEEFPRGRAFPRNAPTLPFPNVCLGVSVEDPKTWRERTEVLKQVPAAVRWVSYEPALADLGEIDLRGINWLVCGGESGPGARPMHPDWTRSARDQCIAAGVPFFFKQWGEFAPQKDDDHGPWPGSKVEKWEDSPMLIKYGKKAAGRLLDGREWNEYPKLATGN
jgi:protein gp37